MVGHGMVGHRFFQELVALGAHDDLAITVFGEEPVVAYDRVRLSTVFGGADPADLCLVEPGFAETNGIEVITGDPVRCSGLSSRPTAAQRAS